MVSLFFNISSLLSVASENEVLLRVIATFLLVISSFANIFLAVVLYKLTKKSNIELKNQELKISSLRELFLDNYQEEIRTVIQNRIEKLEDELNSSKSAPALIGPKGDDIYEEITDEIYGLRKNVIEILRAFDINLYQEITFLMDENKNEVAKALRDQNQEINKSIEKAINLLKDLLITLLSSVINYDPLNYKKKERRFFKEENFHLLFLILAIVLVFSINLISSL